MHISNVGITLPFTEVGYFKRMDNIKLRKFELSISQPDSHTQMVHKNRLQFDNN